MSSIHFSNGFTMAAEVAAEASRVLESSSLPSFPSLGDALYSGGGSPPAIPLQGEEGRPHGKEPQGQAEVGLKPDAGEGGQTQAATWGKTPLLSPQPVGPIVFCPLGIHIMAITVGRATSFTVGTSMARNPVAAFT